MGEGLERKYDPSLIVYYGNIGLTRARSLVVPVGPELSLERGVASCINAVLTSPLRSQKLPKVTPEDLWNGVDSHRGFYHDAFDTILLEHPSEWQMYKPILTVMHNGTKEPVQQMAGRSTAAALRCAHRHGIRSIAFPLMYMNTERQGEPKLDKVVLPMVRSFQQHLETQGRPRTIFLYAKSLEQYEGICNRFDRVFGRGKESRFTEYGA